MTSYYVILCVPGGLIWTICLPIFLSVVSLARGQSCQWSNPERYVYHCQVVKYNKYSQVRTQCVFVGIHCISELFDVVVPTWSTMQVHKSWCISTDTWWSFLFILSDWNLSLHGCAGAQYADLKTAVLAELNNCTRFSKPRDLKSRAIMEHSKTWGCELAWLYRFGIYFVNLHKTTTQI